MAEYNPFDPAVSADPYPWYAQLRDDDPVHHVAAMNAFVVSRYDDVVQVVRSHDTFSSSAIMDMSGPGGPGGAMNMGGADDPVAESMRMGGMGGMDMGGIRFLLNSDPPDHTKLRRLVTKPFTPSAIAALEPRVKAIAEELVDDMLAAARGGPIDLVEQLAMPLPMIVIAEMMGIEAERRDDFRRWSNAMIGAMSPDYDFMAGAGSMMEMWGYFTEIINKRRAAPEDDLISALVSGAEPLNDMELLMFCMLLLIAGNETTTNLIGNGVLAFFNNPEQGERLRADPTLVAPAIEEVLRYDAPVQALWRQATTDVEMHGVKIPEKAIVMVLYASANRDERHFEGADRFDIGRNPKDHVAFGSGIHFCLGAPLARLEARVVAETLLERVAAIRPAGEPTRNPNPILRGVATLPVTVEPA